MPGRHLLQHSPPYTDYNCTFFCFSHRAVCEVKAQVCLTYLLRPAWWLVLKWMSIIILSIPPLTDRTVCQSSGFSSYSFREECPTILQNFCSLWGASDLGHTTYLEGSWQTLGTCVVSHMSDWLGHFQRDHSFHSFVYSPNTHWVCSVLGTALGTVDSMNNDTAVKLSSVCCICQAFSLGTY